MKEKKKNKGKNDKNVEKMFGSKYVSIAQCSPYDFAVISIVS